MGLTALLTLLLTQTPADAGPGQDLIIADGAATQAEAEVKLDAARQAMKAWPAAFELAPGYPRVLESATVAGLKPGFFVVALGACARGVLASPEQPALRAFQAWAVGVYSRPVSGVALACPTLRAGVKVSAEVQPVQKQRLGVWTVTTAAGCEGALVLTGPKGEAVGKEAVSGDTCASLVNRTGTRWCGVEEVFAPRCTTPDRIEVTTCVEVRGGVLVRKEDQVLLHKGECD